MKKLLAAILVFILVCGCALGETAATDLTGDWYVNMYGVVMTLTLNEDGSALLTMAGAEQPETGTWETEDGTLWLNRGTDDEIALTIEEAKLVSEASGMEFTREEPVTFTAPKPVESDDIAAFDGTWNMTWLTFNGLSIDADTAMAQLGENLGLSEPTITISNGTALIFGDNEQPFAFIGGMLYVESPDEDQPTMAQLIALCDDGSLVYDFAGVQFYFEKAE